MKEIVLLVGIAAQRSLIDMSPEYIKMILSTALAVTVGLVLRLAFEWQKGMDTKDVLHKLTWGKAVVYSVFSVSIGYMSFFLLHGKSFVFVPAEVWISILSFAAPFLVKALNTASRDRSREAVDSFLDRVLGKKKDNK